MANPHKGEVTFKAGEDSHTLSFSANALAELEDMLGVGVNEIGSLMADPANIRMTTMRTIFHAGLLDENPDVDLKQAKAIFSKVMPTEAVGLIVRAFTLAFPDAPAEGDANPPKPGQDGTGQSS
ncbi:hypothetical protein ASD45_08550 [Pseudolabrys sp. Root1462]|uniref:hypothetical protein n=1 Tax=Pseudolabrys sp. Root1462 TaxID=1736466 RepID=UPI0007028FFD|nr:hypothetical protein [Pseudolabrys sp. Root1462]KQZ00903.1 hypothetical protein ASD45_08550 [Pseudolabrys sp. Root1462]